MTDNPLPRPGAAHPAITEAMIATLVARFYAKAREDAVIGPIFMGAVADWDEHIANIADFWSSVMLRTGRYHGRPMRPHLILPLEPQHFDRWLALFEETAAGVCGEPDVANEFIIRARRIADSFEMGRATVTGAIARPRHSRG